MERSVVCISLVFSLCRRYCCHVVRSGLSLRPEKPSRKRLGKHSVSVHMRWTYCDVVDWWLKDVRGVMAGLRRGLTCLEVEVVMLGVACLVPRDMSSNLNTLQTPRHNA